MDDQQKHIDELLERHLGLLDTYTTLRQQLSALQAGIYQDIARANFAAERGVRYGMDHYDGRMRAVRRVEIVRGEDGVPAYSVREGEGEREGEENEDEEKQRQAQDGAEEKQAGGENGETQKQAEEDREEEMEQQQKEEQAEDEAQTRKRRAASVRVLDPLRWFGLFAPPALRSAQTRAVQAVGEVVPRLLSVSAEMADLEIQVRRARKRRAKEALAAERQAAAADVVAAAAAAAVASDGTAGGA